MLYYDRTDISELMLIRQAYQKSAIFVTIGVWGFKFQQYVWNRYHDLLMMPMNLRDIATLNNKGADYPCITAKYWFN